MDPSLIKVACDSTYLIVYVLFPHLPMSHEAKQHKEVSNLQNQLAALPSPKVLSQWVAKIWTLNQWSPSGWRYKKSLERKRVKREKVVSPRARHP